MYYRDLDAYPFPGATVLLAAAFQVFGESVGVARALAAGVYGVALLALYAAALQVVDRARAALFGLGLLAWKVWSWPAWSAYFYSDLAFALGALAWALLLARPRPAPARWLVAAGLCAGLAVTAKQNLGLYLGAALAAALWLGSRPERRRAALAAAALGFALPLAAGLAVFTAQGVLGAALESGLVRPFTGYWPASGVSFAPPLRWWELGGLQRLPGHPYLPGVAVMLLGAGAPGGASGLAAEVFARLLYTSVPLALAWALWRGGRGSGLEPRLRELSLGAAAFTLSAFPRADYFHVASVYPWVALLLLALWASGRSRGGGATAAPAPAPRLLAAGVALLLLASGAVARAHLAQFRQPLDLPRARLWISPFAAFVAPLARHVTEQVPPGAPFFVYGHEAWYYFFADRYSPWRFAQLYPGQDGGDGGRALVELLRREPPALIVRGAVGQPSLRTTTPRLFRFVEARYEPDPRVFGAGPPPPRSLVSPLRLRAGER